MKHIHPLSGTGNAGFTLLETLAALAVSALMIGAILGAQGLVLRAETRARSEPLLRCAVSQLLGARMQGRTLDEDLPPAGIAWRTITATTSETNLWRQWDVRLADNAAASQTLFFEERGEK